MSKSGDFFAFLGMAPTSPTATGDWVTSCSFTPPAWYSILGMSAGSARQFGFFQAVHGLKGGCDETKDADDH
jgi:hypothetical protein